MSLADVEWLFQHVPNFIGIQGGEHLSALYRDGASGEMLHHHRLTRLCAKYGMFYQEADGTYKDDKRQELMDRQGPFLRRYGQYLVLSQKNNIIRRQFYSLSCAWACGSAASRITTATGRTAASTGRTRASRSWAYARANAPGCWPPCRGSSGRSTS